jgi:hypothetical protein
MDLGWMIELLKMVGCEELVLLLLLLLLELLRQAQLRGIAGHTSIVHTRVVG